MFHQILFGKRNVYKQNNKLSQVLKYNNFFKIYVSTKKLIWKLKYTIWSYKISSDQLLFQII